MLIILSCLSAWFIPFLLFSPYVFGFTKLKFGYDTRLGICDCKTEEGNNSLMDLSSLEIMYITFILGVTLLCVLLVVTSYIYLGLFIKKEADEISAITQVISLIMC